MLSLNHYSFCCHVAVVFAFCILTQVKLMDSLHFIQMLVVVFYSNYSYCDINANVKYTTKTQRGVFHKLSVLLTSNRWTQLSTWHGNCCTCAPLLVSIWEIDWRVAKLADIKRRKNRDQKRIEKRECELSFSKWCCVQFFCCKSGSIDHHITPQPKTEKVSSLNQQSNHLRQPPCV